MMRLRLRLLAIGLTLGFLAVVGRSFQLQILPSAKVKALANRQLLQRIDLVGRRGTIRDRNGRELAVSTNTLSVFVNPKLVKDPGLVARTLAPVLRTDAEGLKARLKDNGSRKFAWLARQLNEDSLARLQGVDLKSLAGVGVLREYRRQYPHGSLAAHALGFVSVDGKGVEGLERGFDESLRADREQITLRRDALGRPLFTEADEIRLDSAHGQDLELTIDAHLQFSLESALSEAVKKHEAVGGTAIVLDPHNGDILAAASLPVFDPNEPGIYPAQTRRNRLLTDPIEPGSVVKPFVVAQALQDKIVKASSKISAGNGFIKIGRKTIGEADAKHRFKTINMVDLIRYSSNVGTVVLQQKMGWDRVEKAFRGVGLIGSTGVDLGPESKGLFRRPSPQQLLEQATMSFGQGIATTPLQIATAYATIANGGFRIRPRFVRDSKEAPRERVFSESVAKTMRGILEKVVEDEGTGTAARIEGFQVAGKTGTSQKVDYEGRGYKAGAYWSSFAGFLPAQDPRFVIYVMLDEPRKGGYYGGVVAAPAFAKIASAALRFSTRPAAGTPEKASALPAKRLAEKPLERKRGSSASLPDLAGLPLSSALRILQERGAALELIGHGRFVEAQLPSAGTRLEVGDRVILRLR